MQRLEALNNQVQPNATMNLGQVGQKSDDDIVIISMARTAMTRAKRGPQKDTAPEVMLKVALKSVVEKAGIDAKQVDDIVIGNVLQGGAGSTTSRMAQLLAGIPHTTPLQGINRLCSSGLQACATVANQIKNHEIDIGIGGGVESMSLFSMMDQVDPSKLSDLVFEDDQANACLMPMGITSENVAEQFGVSRVQQDTMAYESHQKAALSDKMGWSRGEITPYTTIVKDKDGNEKQVLVDRDDGMRPQTTIEGLSKLKPAFKKGGTTTAGNSSQVTDGAAVVMLTRRSHAKKLGLKIHGRFISFATAGVPPKVMGIGPAFAIPKALSKAGLKVEDIDIFEINEAFASQATYTVNKLGVPKEKLNPRGGAIALGHPLGMTGARMINTLFSELDRTGKKLGIVSMCIGTGMGAAGIFERE